MIFLCLFLLVACLLLCWRLVAHKRMIRLICEQLDFLCSRDTQAELTAERVDTDLQELVTGINRLLEKFRKTGQEIEKNDALFRDTITSLSHDLRTPLATANGYIQLLQGQDFTSEQQAYLGIAGDRISAVKLLLDQLFEFAKIEANELRLHNRNTDINSVLRDTVAAYYSDFEKKGEGLEIIIPNSPAVVWADEDALIRIFSNIIHNALIHGDGGYKISAATAEEHCDIVFSNHSAAIRQEDLPHLFDRFYTTDQSRNKKTTGLGLAIASKLTFKMGGVISAHLEKGVFEIRLSFPIQT